MNNSVGCSVGAYVVVVSIAWVLLLLSSLVSRPDPDDGPRKRDRALVACSILMVLGVVAMLLAS